MKPRASKHHKFSVGQRVRFTARGHAVPRGSLGTVAAPAGIYRPDVHGNSLTYGVRFDDVPTQNGYPRGWCCLPEDIEPVYDGNHVVGWSDCAWQPRLDKAAVPSVAETIAYFAMVEKRTP